jgi:hypothetical protein
MATGMIIDGVFASQAIDSSGEILDVEGCDISTLSKDGVANYEHKEGDKKGSGNNGEEIVGKIVYAKKVFGASDCDTDREKKYWSDIKVPFVYGMVRLYDGAGHSGAQALAAQIRDHHANGDPILVRFSIEGSTLERDGQRLKTSVARRVALTLKPCNRTAVSGLIEDPKAPIGFDKKPANQEVEVDDILAGLVEKGEVLQHPNYTKLGGAHELQADPLVDEDALTKTAKLWVKAKILKALTAGSYAGTAPSNLTQGSALQREDSGLRTRMKNAVNNYKPAKNFDKAEFKAFAKAFLPEADDSFMDHFADVAHDYHMKRMRKAEEDLDKAAKKSKPLPSPDDSNELALEPKKATKKDLEFPPKEPKPKLPKPSSIAPAQGKELEAAIKATHKYKKARKDGTGPTEQVLERLVPHVVNGVELSGKDLARYLNIPEPAPVPLTVRGEPALPSEHAKPHFDHETGYLHVPPSKATFSMTTGKWSPGHTGGKFKFYIPGHYDPALHGPDAGAGAGIAKKELENFHGLLDDEQRTKYHDVAMDNWSKAHQLMHAGQTPDELAMHSALFSMLSPNTPVPMHELMYGYLVDSMKHTGIDARNPAFGGKLGEKISGLLRSWRASKAHGRAATEKPDLENPEEFGIFGDWKGRDTGETAPTHAPSHWERVKHAITLGGDQKFDPKNPDKPARKQGMFGSFMLAQDKFGNMAKYAKNHEAFHKLFLEHGPKDPKEIVNQLLHHKVEGGKFDNARKTAQRSGKTSFNYGGQEYSLDAKYPHGLIIEGLAPKTGRFAVTMSGAGNMWVPDTHMVRYNFGLEKAGSASDDEEDDDDDSTGKDQKDKRSIKAIKAILWNENHHHLMNKMDEYYTKHSPAIDHMVSRAEKKGWYLHGATPEEKRKNATFGAFWKNWSAIKGHEESRGYQTGSSNDYSDHLPFWEAVKHLFKAEDMDESLPMRTAAIHSAWVRKYGEMGAQYMFMRHLLPQLLGAAAIRTAPHTIRKFEALAIDLRKAVADVQAKAEEPADERVVFAGNKVVPGHAITAKGEYALLHEDADHFVAVPKENVGDWCHHHLVKLPKTKQGTHYRVTRRPSVFVTDLEG